MGCLLLIIALCCLTNPATWGLGLALIVLLFIVQALSSD